MTSDPDRRIDELERQLAKIQAEETTPQTIEANLTRQSLRSTLATAAVIAVSVVGVLDDLSAEMAANVQRMADDLNGGREGR